MNRCSANWFLTGLAVFVAACLFLAQTPVLLAAPAVTQDAGAGGKAVKPTTITAVRVGVSPPMRDMKPAVPEPHDPHHLRELPDMPPQLHPRADAPEPHDPLVQRQKAAGLMPGPLRNFDGVGNVNGVQPADTTMDVSDDATNQILQWVNLSYEVWDKSGNHVAGPFAGTNFWAGLTGSPCQTFNGGDILVRWDQFASRWFVSQLAYPGGSQGFHQCVAVSTTSDAAGAYYQYDFLYSLTVLNDYPKVGLWPDPTNDGYYITVRNFGPPNESVFTGMKIIALNRVSMLAGSPGTAQVFDVGALAPNLDGLLPADLRGINTPPNGSLETYIGYGHPNTDGSFSPVIHLFQTFVDFSNPANSTLTQLSDIAVSDFDPNLPSGAPQVGGGALETLPFSLYRADYRVFSDHDSLLLLHDVNVDTACGTGEQSGERWHEVRGVHAGGPPFLYQEGTYGPCDGTYRWMGSIAQDGSGDVALGFSASSDGNGIVNDPSVHSTGRLVADPPGQMTQGEGSFLDSTQAFSGGRWGDYSTTVVDPTDQCTFWYTTMYGAGDWKTRIGSFKFPSCTTGPVGKLEGHVTDTSNGNPIADASVTATGTAGPSSTVTDANGHYSLLLPPDTYNMTVTAYGYLPDSATGDVVTNGGDTIQDFALAAAPVTTVSGTVTDGSGQGWPLYAKLVITAPGVPILTLYTDPLTGAYSKDLVQGQGITYTFTVDAVSPGYNKATATISLLPFGAPVIQSFSLTIDAAECGAPGYLYPGAIFSSFGGGVLPPGWSVVNNSGRGAGWYIETGPAPCGEFGGNLTGGKGPFAVINSDCDGQIQDDAELRTPSVDMSSISDPSVRFNLDYYGFYTTSVADVDISTNGGNSWTNVFEICCGSDRPGPTSQQVNITSIAAGKPSVMARFHYTGFNAWWWQVDDVLLGSAAATCQPGTGGLVIGNVRAANTTLGLNGATVTNAGGFSTPTFATPKDPNQDDGFYILFAPPGAQTLHASLPAFPDDIQTPTVVAGSVIRQDFNLRFLDVPDSSIYANFIYGLVGAGITAGCGGGNYCPDASVTRAQMAVFIEKAAHGPSFVPPACAAPGIFGDVPCPGGFAVNFIEALYRHGIAAGCSASPLLYCPNDPVTRAQMAVFIEKGAHGPAYSPPACTPPGVFADVPCPGGFAVDYIEALFNDGIAAGCGGGNYCPNDPVTRAEMAVFIDTGLHVPHP